MTVTLKMRWKTGYSESAIEARRQTEASGSMAWRSPNVHKGCLQDFFAHGKCEDAHYTYL